MKLKSILSSLAIFFLAQCVFAQEKMIQLEDIWASRTFSPEWVWGINSMNDGIHYSSLNYGDKNVHITQYSYETGDSISTIVDSKDLDGISFSDYSFSEDEKKVLLPTETESIYRYSTRSNYYVYDRETKIAEELSEGKQRLAQFSPDASKVAFVKENNIFIKHIIAKCF